MTEMTREVEIAVALDENRLDDSTKRCSQQQDTNASVSLQDSIKISKRIWL